MTLEDLYRTSPSAAGHTAESLCQLLEQRYMCRPRPPAGPKYAMAYEVVVPRIESDWWGIGTRRIDAVAVGLWASTGHAVHGFEVKVSRPDLRSELVYPGKGATGAAYCDYWWLVLSDRSLIRDGELPEGWGLLVPRGNHLVALTPAARNESPRQPRELIAGLMGSTFRAGRRLGN